MGTMWDAEMEALKLDGKIKDCCILLYWLGKSLHPQVYFLAPVHMWTITQLHRITKELSVSS